MPGRAPTPVRERTGDHHSSRASRGYHNAHCDSRTGSTGPGADFGITAADYPRIATDALADEMRQHPRRPGAADTAAILGLPGDPRQLRLGLKGDQPPAGDPAKLAVDPGEQVPA
jgi:hypothetical protein